MADEDVFEQIDPTLFNFAVVVDYRIPFVPVQNSDPDDDNGIWIRIRALAGIANARVGVQVVNAAREESQRSLRVPLQVQNPERPTNSAQAPLNQIQDPTNLPSSATQSITHAASEVNPNLTRNPNSTGDPNSTSNPNSISNVPRRHRYYEENPPIDPSQLQPNSSAGHTLPTLDKAVNPMYQLYQRLRNFFRTIIRRRRVEEGT